MEIKSSVLFTDVPPDYVFRFSDFPGARLPFFPGNGCNLREIFQETVEAAVFPGVQVYGYGFYFSVYPRKFTFHTL